MPHFGLMDADALGPIEAPLMRARLHIRGGRRRLRQGIMPFNEDELPAEDPSTF